MKKEKCYRIVEDSYCGYEVQVKVKFLWRSWWEQVGKFINTNTFYSLEDAQKWINEGCPKDRNWKSERKVYWTSPHCKEANP